MPGPGNNIKENTIEIGGINYFPKKTKIRHGRALNLKALARKEPVRFSEFSVVPKTLKINRITTLLLKDNKIFLKLLLFLVIIGKFFPVAFDLSAREEAFEVYQDWPFSAEEAKRRQNETAKMLGVATEKYFDLGNGHQIEFVLIPAGKFFIGPAEPVEPNWAYFEWESKKNQVIFCLGVLSFFFFIWPIIKIKTRFQFHLSQMLKIFFSIGIIFMGGIRWLKNHQAFLAAQNEHKENLMFFSEAHKGEKPCHPLSINKPFFLGKFEVTQKIWELVMGSNPSQEKGPLRPVETVSWNEIQEFLEKLKLLTGEEFRLPTEAEWEYACRAGTNTRFNLGNKLEDLDRAGWFLDNSFRSAKPVGQKEQNRWGLFDMHGNVSEWCQDCFLLKYSERFPANLNDSGLFDCDWRPNRGGCFFSEPTDCRSTARSACARFKKYRILGFRLCTDVRSAISSRSL